MGILSFSWTNRYLSNFHDCEIEMDGKTYKSVEHAYQASKTFIEKDRVSIQKCAKASEAKRLGGHITKGTFSTLREDWYEINISVMRELVKQKFTKHTKLGDRLLETGDQMLEEGNNWDDTFWGTVNGVGENHLGLILMDVRTEIRKERKEAHDQTDIHD